MSSRLPCQVPVDTLGVMNKIKSMFSCQHDCLLCICIILYTSVHPLPSLLAKLFPSPMFSANNTLLHTDLWYKLHLLLLYSIVLHIVMPLPHH